jgi:transcriptional regulator with XRE-family HTH domain
MTVKAKRMQAVSTALGKRVAALRVEAGMTQEALADKLDSAKSVVSRIEHGAIVPSLNRLVEIADALGVDVGELFAGVKVPPDDAREAAIGEIAAALRKRPVEDARLVAEIARAVAKRS